MSCGCTSFKPKLILVVRVPTGLFITHHLLGCVLPSSSTANSCFTVIAALAQRWGRHCLAFFLQPALVLIPDALQARLLLLCTLSYILIILFTVLCPFIIAVLCWSWQADVNAVADVIARPIIHFAGILCTIQRREAPGRILQEWRQVWSSVEQLSIGSV